MKICPQDVGLSRMPSPKLFATKLADRMARSLGRYFVPGVGERQEKNYCALLQAVGKLGGIQTSPASVDATKAIALRTLRLLIARCLQ